MKVVVDVRGKQSEWGIPSDLPTEAIEAMRADGLNIIVPEYTVPYWVAQSGMGELWMFLQDVWNLRNPFRK